MILSTSSQAIRLWGLLVASGRFPQSWTAPRLSVCASFPNARRKRGSHRKSLPRLRFMKLRSCLKPAQSQPEALVRTNPSDRFPRRSFGFVEKAAFQTLRSGLQFAIIVFLCFSITGCRTKYREDLDYSHRIEQTWQIDELHFGELVQFETVQWNPDDDTALRAVIVEDAVAAGRDVLEIGTATGLLAILCAQNDADKVVATDTDPVAVANAAYNAAILVPDASLDIRESEASAPYSALRKMEKFDLILVNPSWLSGNQNRIGLLIGGLSQHLRPGGRCILTETSPAMIDTLKQAASEHHCDCKILGEQDLQSDQERFSPAVIVELRPPLLRGKVGDGNTAEADSNQSDQG